MSSYHQKYLKYKNKYLELKKALNFPETSLNQMGGSSFTEMEQFTATPVATETYGYHLRENALDLEGGFPSPATMPSRLVSDFNPGSKEKRAAEEKTAEERRKAEKTEETRRLAAIAAAKTPAPAKTTAPPAKTAAAPPPAKK